MIPSKVKSVFWAKLENQYGPTSIMHCSPLMGSLLAHVKWMVVSTKSTLCPPRGMSCIVPTQSVADGILLTNNNSSVVESETQPSVGAAVISGGRDGVILLTGVGACVGLTVGNRVGIFVGIVVGMGGGDSAGAGAGAGAATVGDEDVVLVGWFVDSTVPTLPIVH